MSNKIEDYLRDNIGKIAIAEDNSGSGAKIKFSGEILEVFDDAFLRMGTINKTIICNLNRFQALTIIDD